MTQPWVWTATERREGRPFGGPRRSDPTGGVGFLEHALGAIESELEHARRLSDQLLQRFRDWDAELALAQQVQRELLPACLPDVRGARLESWYAPLDRISGDFYDVFRVHERMIALAIADATGHGVPAALMSAFLKRSLRCRDRMPDDEQARRPDQALQRVNADLLHLGATQEQYVAAVYATYEEDTRRLCVARGGAPAPLLMRHDGRVEPLEAEGILLGAVEHPRFTSVERILDPGDVVLLWSDGLENLVEGCPDDVAGKASVCEWRRTLRADDMSRQLAAWRQRRLDLRSRDWRGDDITVLTLACTS